jgi:hypothetical protein
VSALGELIEALRAVEDQLGQARGQLAQGRKSLTEAEAALARLDPDHPETVVPPGLHRADDQIERTLTLVDHVTDTLRAFMTRL